VETFHVVSECNTAVYFSWCLIQAENVISKTYKLYKKIIGICPFIHVFSFAKVVLSKNISSEWLKYTDKNKINSIAYEGAQKLTKNVYAIFLIYCFCTVLFVWKINYECLWNSLKRLLLSQYCLNTCNISTIWQSTKVSS